MVIASLAPDRRAALKARHRAAILAAARELVDERSGPKFSVDELAERADVARRTVFNHFASVDEVLLALSANALDVIMDDFVVAVATGPVHDSSRASMFDDLAETLRSADLPVAIASLARILGDPDGDNARSRALTDVAFSRMSELLIPEVARRAPQTDPLDVELLVSSLFSGVVVIATHWIKGSYGRLDAASRAEWKALLDRLIDNVRSGYLPTV